MLIRLGHSADPDGAFMFWALSEGLIDTRGYEFEHVLRDAETLDEWALQGRLEVTAISLHAYPRVQGRYVLLPHGASMGAGYGPMVVAPEPLPRDELRSVEIAVPAHMTTAFLLLRMYLGDFAYRVVPSGAILDEVRSGRAPAGLVANDSVPMYEDGELIRCVDLGEWWLLETGLPLPLVVNVARRDLGEDVLHDLSDVFGESIDMGLRHRKAWARQARRFGRALEGAPAAPFVDAHGGDRTLDYGAEGRQAVRELLRRAEASGAYSAPVQVEFVG